MKVVLRKLEAAEKKVKKRLVRVQGDFSIQLQDLLAKYWAKGLDAKSLSRPLSFDELHRLHSWYEGVEADVKRETGHEMRPWKKWRVVTLGDALYLEIYALDLALAFAELSIIKPHLYEMATVAFQWAEEQAHPGISPRTLTPTEKETITADTAIHDGQTWEDTLLHHHEIAAKTTYKEVVAAAIRGAEYKDTDRVIVEPAVKRARNYEYKLLFTEGTATVNNAIATVFETVYERYTYKTAGDDGVCENCAALEGCSFLYSSRIPGVNFPPLHPWCRCYTVPEG